MYKMEERQLQAVLHLITEQITPQVVSKDNQGQSPGEINIAGGTSAKQLAKNETETENKKKKFFKRKRKQGKMEPQTPK